MAVAEALAPGVRRAGQGNVGQWAAFLGGAFGVGVFNAFNVITLPLWLSGFTTSYLLIGLLSNTRSFEGALVSPVTCALSDRTWLGWLGRRRPYILVGGVASGLLLAATPLVAPSGGGPAGGLARLVPAIVAIFFFTFAFNVMDDVHRTLMADISEGAARTRLAGLSVVAAALGQVVILIGGSVVWRNGVPGWAFGTAGVLVIAGSLVTVVGVRESPPAAAADPLPPIGDSLRALAGLERSALVFCLANLCYWTGANAILPLLPLFARDVLGGTVGEAQLLPGLLLLASTICALPAARLANRWGKRRTLALGQAIVLVAAAAAFAITTVDQGMLTFALAGVGSAAVLVLPVPILADLVPRARVGAAVGLLAAGGSIAAPLASLLAGAIAERYGLRAVFVVMLGFGAAALALLPATRLRSADEGEAPEE